MNPRSVLLPVPMGVFVTTVHGAPIQPLLTQTLMFEPVLVDKAPNFCQSVRIVGR